MLPEIKEINRLDVFTPTIWQTVILRNYGLVSTSKIAQVLDTTEDVIQQEAQRLGIEKIPYDANWLKCGYITIIRNNWHLLNYNQLITLLNADEKWLDYVLKEDDFLSVKLGGFKPYCDTVKYSPLDCKQIDATEKLQKVIKENFIENYARPFEFYKTQTCSVDDKNDDFTKIVYGYSMLYGDTLCDGGEIISDKQLMQYKAVGVNGLWIQGVLSKLSPYPFVDGVSTNYEVRRKNLNKLISRCAKYGIGVYLYLNEPRALSHKDFSSGISHLKGRTYQDETALCTSKQEVKDYLYNAVYGLSKAVPNLAGIITITMSENLTNCYARPQNDCPLCSKRHIYDVVPEVNNIINRAIKDAGSKTRLIANLWGWNKDLGWSQEDTLKGIDNLDDDIEILCVSEFGTIIKDGKPYYVGEYSISNVGPCEETKANLSYAKKTGRKILAKVQINNSWEFPIVPYLPVFKLVEKHLFNLKELMLDGLMESWTLGGYPSASLDLANNIFSDNYNYAVWLKKHFGDNYNQVEKAVELFSQAFTEFPFSQGTLYLGAQAQGPSNLWYRKQTGLKSTMVCYPYDDIESWRGDFSEEEYLTKLQRMCNKWEKGLSLLDATNGNENYCDLKRYAEVFLVNIQAVINGFKYNQARNRGENELLNDYLNTETSLTKTLYKLASEDCKVGYEASNHYFFTQNTFLEKLINLETLKNR